MELHEENKVMREALTAIESGKVIATLTARDVLAAIGPRATEGNEPDIYDAVRQFRDKQTETVCTLPPHGWYCTRAPGHDGPCAAVAHPVALIGAVEAQSEWAKWRRDHKTTSMTEAIYAWHQAKLAEAIERAVLLERRIAKLASDEQQPVAGFVTPKSERLKTPEGTNVFASGDPDERLRYGYGEGVGKAFVPQQLREGLGKLQRVLQMSTSSIDKIHEFGPDGELEKAWQIFHDDVLPSLATPATATTAKLMSVPQVADMLREMNLLTEYGRKNFLNGAALRFHPADIARIINATLASKPALQAEGVGALKVAEALRQFQHNDGSGLVFGYDIAVIDRVLQSIRAVADELDTQADKNTGDFAEHVRACAEDMRLALAGPPVPTQQAPKAWMRKWYADGEEPVKIKGQWPRKFKYYALTGGKLFPDDLPLYAAPPASADIRKAWAAAVGRAKENGMHLFADSCNHTQQAIDYMAAVMYADPIATTVTKENQ